MKNILMYMVISMLSLSMSGCSYLSTPTVKPEPTAGVEKTTSSQKDSSSPTPETENDTEREKNNEEPNLPDDELFESNVTKEGMTEPVTKIRHHSKLGFSVEYPAKFERYYSDDSIMFKWYHYTLTITKYTGRDMESVKKELTEDFTNLNEDEVEMLGKTFQCAYVMANDMYEIYFFIENGDAIYVAKMYLSVEAMEGLGVDFHDIIDSIKFY